VRLSTDLPSVPFSWGRLMLRKLRNVEICASGNTIRTPNAVVAPMTGSETSVSTVFALVWLVIH
jgi:hypothetical protein